MKSAQPIPDPPDFEGVSPTDMTDRALREWHEGLGAWLEMAESALPEDGPNDRVIEGVRARLRELSRERFDRQSDEQAPRGG